MSAPGAGVSPALGTLVQTQLQAAIGILTNDGIATEKQIEEVKESEIGAARVDKVVRSGHAVTPPAIHPHPHTHQRFNEPP